MTTLKKPKTNKKSQGFGETRLLRNELPKVVNNLGKKFGDLARYINFAAIFSLRLQSKNIGGYILHKDKTLKAVIPIVLSPIDPELLESKLDQAVENFEQGIKSLPSNGSITFRVDSYREYSDRKKDLIDLRDKTTLNEIKYLLTSEIKRGQEISDAGIRKKKKIRAYISIDITQGSRPPEGFFQKAIFSMEEFFVSLSNSASNQTEAFTLTKLQEMLRAIEYSWFSEWSLALSNSFNFSYETMTDEEAWKDLYAQFNSDETPAIPHLLILDEYGVKEEIKASVDGCTTLLANLPLVSQQKIRINGSERASMFLFEKPTAFYDIGIADEPRKGKRGKLRYIWSNLLAREDLADVSFTMQVSRANEKDVRGNLEAIQKSAYIETEKADKYKNYSAGGALTQRQAREALDGQASGQTTCKVAFQISLLRKDQEKPFFLSAEAQLARDCAKIGSFFPKPARWDRELYWGDKYCLQEYPTSIAALHSTPVDKRKLWQSNEVPHPIVSTPLVDPKGFELITKEGGTPVYLDLFTQHKHLALFATQRAGKSVLVSGILTHALAHTIPVVALDFPKPDGSSTFTDYTNYLGSNGAYFDIAKESNNLFEMPDTRKWSKSDWEDRWPQFLDLLETSLLTMVAGSSEDWAATQTIRSILVIGLSAFFKEPSIKARYKAAVEGGFGSSAWQEIPTLVDFYKFCKPENLDFAEAIGNVSQAFQSIDIQLRFWLNSRVGQSISKPSSFPTGAQLLVFALRNLGNDEDAAVLALSAYSAALRRALSSPASIFFIDEAPILFEFPTIAALVARQCANGGKSGIRVILCAQDPDTIAKSSSSSKIFQNLTTRLIGLIKKAAVPSFERILRYPEEVIGRNVSFYPDKKERYSRWLLDSDETLMECRYYPGDMQLGAVANNPDEAISRGKILAFYPDKHEGMFVFSNLLATAMKSGQKITDLTHEFLASKKGGSS